MVKDIFDKERDIPMLIVFGQSNAHGHGTRLCSELEIRTPLENVKGLLRKYNQFYDLDKLIWSGYTSEGMNLGETQDHTYCIATEFARMWQNEISQKKRDLPDLYILQISIGGQGIAREEEDGANMWYPYRKRIMRAGDLSEVNISLYPLAIEILKLIKKEVCEKGKHLKILGLHWNQWETEVFTGGKALLFAKTNYEKVFRGFSDVLGTDFPIYLYKPLSEIYENPEGVSYLTNIFEGFVQEKNNLLPQFRWIDISQSYLWKPDTKDKGIFLEDLVHYNPEAHQWFAEFQFNQIFKEV